jgi:hypothetical protein
MANDPVTTTSGILKALGASCRDDTRRDLLLRYPGLGLNGIDFVEFVQPGGANVLRVHFLFPLPASPSALEAAILASIRIEGGARIVGITALSVSADPTDSTVLDIPVSAQGDFSTYWLSFGWTNVTADNSWQFQLAGIDRQFSAAPINFRPGCPIEFDCAPASPPPPPAQPAPVLDYLAKDFASYSQLLLDLISQRNPTWLETNAADMGIAIVEVLAYQGDYLSYFQDVVANESFLDTVRKRISAKRHARLVDYHMHDGRNAWTYVYFGISPTSAVTKGSLPPGQQLLTRVNVPLQNLPLPPTTMIPSSILNLDTDPALATVVVFETAATARLDALNNELYLHTWGNVQCCLCVGTTVCHVYAVQGTSTAQPDLNPGDLLLFEEVKGPYTGAAADADPTHRQVVRITRVDLVTDELFGAELASGILQVRSSTATTPLQLLEIGWDPVDALTFPLCLSTTLTDGSTAGNLSVARGNIALADHGRTVCDPTITLSPPVASGQNYLLTLARAPITMQCQPPTQTTILGERTDLTLDVQSVTPAVQLAVTGAGGTAEQWAPLPDLLESNEFDNVFVVDVDDDGQGILRFGDDQYGRSMTGAAVIQTKYRVGNGRTGNIGAEGLAHIVMPPLFLPGVTFQVVRNPLPAQDGTDPEEIEQVRQYAPVAFQAVQYRAVTEADYVAAALTVDGVAAAVAQFRWTGSWYTAYLGIDPSDPTNVVTLPGGRTTLDPTFATDVTVALEAFQLAGYDLEVQSAQYVPLLIEVHICVNAGHFQADVVAAVLLALDNGVEPDGSLGFFNPANFAFGQPVYLSQLYAAIDAVEGVDSADVIVFQRYGRQPQGELQNGVIPMGPWEIARLDNDVNLMENGVLIIDADGGK